MTDHDDAVAPALVSPDGDIEPFARLFATRFSNLHAAFVRDAQLPSPADGEAQRLRRFGGWWLSCDAKVESEHLAHALAGDTELRAGVGQGESLDGAQRKTSRLRSFGRRVVLFDVGGSMSPCRLSLQMIS